jgi:hypothetical protein
LQQVFTVTLLLVFLMMMLGLFAIFLGGGLVAQGYLYQNPADRMALRSVAGAVFVAAFVTLWVWIDQRAPGRYDTLFNFTGTSTVEFDEFEAVWWLGADGKLRLDANGNHIEKTVKFKRTPGGKAKFYEEGTTDEFMMIGSTSSDGQYMTGAIRVKATDDPEPVRYNALLKEEKPKSKPEYKEDRRFVEENGSRYVESHQLGTLFVPSTGTIALALLLNIALGVVWLVAFWPILRFSLAHALIFTGAFTLLTMLAVMPVLFKQNRVPKTPTPAPAALISREAHASNS